MQADLPATGRNMVVLVQLHQYLRSYAFLLDLRFQWQDPEFTGLESAPPVSTLLVQI